jgi:putative phosphoesterase
MTMKIGVISDTHLSRVTSGFKEIFQRHLADCDLVCHAGDVTSTAVVDFLSERNFRGVYGNMDPEEVRERLPGKQIVEVGPFRVGLIHGWGSSNGLEARILHEFRDVDAIIYGHSHAAANHWVQDVLLFNPGSATGYTSSGMHSIGILDIDDRVVGRIIPV